jgi:hypothetical protein
MACLEWQSHVWKRGKQKPADHSMKAIDSFFIVIRIMSLKPRTVLPRFVPKAKKRYRRHCDGHCSYSVSKPTRPNYPGICAEGRKK